MSQWKREWRRQQREAWEARQRERGQADDPGSTYEAHVRVEGCGPSRPRERGPFRRYPERGIAAGVIAGLARWLGWSTWAVRGPSIALLVMNPPLFFAAYGTLWVLMEREAVLAWVQRRLPGLPDAVPHAKVEDVRTRLRGLEARAARLEERVTSDAFSLRRRFRTLDGA
ncbi:MAG: PspC domain-containing protein [Alphaproteobacteria bacterium]|nr:PspC domain-containing protein [Alphaproteobacteria bacterium]